MKIVYHSIIFLLLSTFIMSCYTDDPVPPIDPVKQDKTLYHLEHGSLPVPSLPEDNLLTNAGVELGRMLFYETLLSADNSQACADCHRIGDGFSDTTNFSIGIQELPGRRQSMAAFNMAWNSNGFFWDGRAELLRDQVILPIQDELELNESLDNVVQKLSDEKKYLDQFTRTFGTDEVTEEKLALALEQFLFSIVSYDSKYDKWKAGELELSASEERGRALFFTEYNQFFPEFSGADCAHCHGGANFENDRYMNNGLDEDDEFTDLGRFEATNKQVDKAKFKVPTLRNIALTPPYMHDGRFQTLEEVVDHYNDGLKSSSTMDPALQSTMGTGLFLDDQDKSDLVDFLKTLTDESLSTNEKYMSPF